MTTRRASKRGNSEGSIYQRDSDGLWVGSITLGFDGGKQRRRTVYGKTRKEAADKLGDLVRLREDGESIMPNRATLGAFLERWVTEALSARDLKPTTIENYTIIVRRHLVPALGSRRLADLSAADVQRLINAKRASGLSDRTVQLVYVVLRRALAQAVRWQEARRNVAALR